ncbi:hypothetical protein GCM10023238_13500 [Streptomyces heliomycini]
MSIPPPEVTSTVCTASAPSTAASPVHRGPLAGRTNHPEMSLLPVVMAATLRPAGPVEADQHAPGPV